MSEYLYEINGYTVGVDKSKEDDDVALCIIKQIEEQVKPIARTKKRTKESK